MKNTRKIPALYKIGLRETWLICVISNQSEDWRALYLRGFHHLVYPKAKK